VFSEHCGGGTLHHVEAEPQTNLLARALDIEAGVDAIQEYVPIPGWPKQLRGIAFRTQTDGIRWGTTTLREEREKGTPTEYDKRRAWYLNRDAGWFHAYLTVQAYFDGGVAGPWNLLSMAIVTTEDFLGLALGEEGRDWERRDVSNATFRAVRWETFRERGCWIDEWDARIGWWPKEEAA
jgi:hypothetical protein